MSNVYYEIKKDKQIWKFCFYGLLKNLKFFEPYLLLYLVSLGINLFEIGILISIRELVTYIFEIPSGIFADNYGKKKELMLCFSFYIASFIFFFLGYNFHTLVIAMILFGLGEAFRSGTHKAMIYSYLEQKGWFEYKAFVYGRTRSFSLIGSSIAAFVSIILIINLPNVRWIFLLSIIPYILDFVLILSYPNSLDEKRRTEFSIKLFINDSINQLKSIGSNKNLIKLLLSSSIYDGIFKTIKDYIQPILKIALLSTSITYIKDISLDDSVKIYLGIIYGVFYIFSSIASRNVYKLNKLFKSDKLMGVFFDIMAVLSIALYLSIENNMILFIVAIFFMLYILKDARRPIFVDICGDHMNKEERATVMSIDGQLRALFTVILAPLFGYIAQKLSIGILFLFIGVLIVVINRFLHLSEMNKEI